MYFLKLTYIWLNYYQIHIVVYKTNLHVHIAWLSKGIQHSAGPLITSFIILPLKSELHELNTVYKNISHPFYSPSLDGSLHVVKIKQNHYTVKFLLRLCVALWRLLTSPYHFSPYIMYFFLLNFLIKG